MVVTCTGIEGSAGAKGTWEDATEASRGSSGIPSFELIDRVDADVTTNRPIFLGAAEGAARGCCSGSDGGLDW